jgi:hypothetical protein
LSSSPNRSGRRVIGGVRPLLLRRQKLKVRGRVSRDERLWVAGGRGEIQGVRARLAGHARGALRVESRLHRGLTSACTRPATRGLSCFGEGAGGRVMRGVMLLPVTWRYA